MLYLTGVARRGQTQKIKKTKIKNLSLPSLCHLYGLISDPCPSLYCQLLNLVVAVNLLWLDDNSLTLWSSFFEAQPKSVSWFRNHG